MYLETPTKFKGLVNHAQQVARAVFRPISRKYDRKEHHYPIELDMLSTLLDAMNDATGSAAGTGKLSQKNNTGELRNGSNLATVLGLIELCWGDAGLALTLPRQGLGNAAITAIANEEQLSRFGNKWAAMAITEPEAGSDSAAIRTTAVASGNHYIINGEKIFVTSGDRADAIIVWATLDPSKGRAAIKSFVVEKGTPGMQVVRLEKKLGIKASDTATIHFDNCRIPKTNLLGTPEIDTKKSFAGVMQTFDNTRPVVAAMAVGVAKASLERARQLIANDDMPYTIPLQKMNAIDSKLLDMEAELESARLLTLKAAWMADNGQPNSMEASMAKAKAARIANSITLDCVALCGTSGYMEDELLEKWARDSKILDIFEGTQQIQKLIIARRLLGKSSKELK